MRPETPPLVSEDGKKLLGCGSLDDIPEQDESLVINGSHASDLRYRFSE